MTLDEILASLFPGGGARVGEDGLISGAGTIPGVGEADVVGVANGAALGVEGAARLAGMTLDIIKAGRGRPLLVLIDSDSQRMSRRDELLGLSEYLAHLAKCLRLAELSGVRTVGILYGHTAAGAFIATALATGVLVALPGANPEVMDLPSMARVTKLPLEVLQEKAKSTPVFAPGLDNLARTGAVREVWDPARPLPEQLAALLAQPVGADVRDELGAQRGGRPRAQDVARRVEALADG